MPHEKPLDPRGSKHLVHRTEDFIRFHLVPGTPLDKLNQKVCARIERRTQWSTLPKSCILSFTSEERVVSLYKWCGEVLVDASTRAFYGDALVDTEPTVVHDFLEFDQHDWMLLYQYPAFLAKKMSAPRERVLQCIARYLSLPSQRTQDSPAHDLNAQLVQAGMSTRDRAVYFQMFHFA